MKYIRRYMKGGHWVYVYQTKPRKHTAYSKVVEYKGRKGEIFSESGDKVKVLFYDKNRIEEVPKKHLK